MKRLLSLLLLLIIQYQNLSGTAWHEPWQEEIIKEADSFVKGRIIDLNENEVKVEILEIFGGEHGFNELLITNFYLLDLCSKSAGHGPNFEYLDKDDLAYFFLKKNDENNYSIPTPTSGYAKIEEGEVYASYRHSYHQALISTKIYEESMLAIWNYYHGQDFDEEITLKYLEEQLSKEPAGLEENELMLFFKQHVALELIYHLRLDFEVDKIIPFLDSENFHAQVSAIRALKSSKDSKSVDLYLEVLKKTEIENFCKTLAIEALSIHNWQNHRKQLKKIRKKLSDEQTGFGGSIMDPRICTKMDSPKEAIDKLLGKKKKKRS